MSRVYLKNDPARYRASYPGLARELQDAIPGSSGLIETIDRHVGEGSLYKALKDIRQLMRREEELAAA